MADQVNIHEIIESCKQFLSMNLDIVEQCPLTMVEDCLKQIDDMLPMMKENILDAKKACADPRERFEYESLKTMKQMEEMERMRQNQMLQAQEPLFSELGQINECRGEQQQRSDQQSMSDGQLSNDHRQRLSEMFAQAVDAMSPLERRICPSCGAEVPEGEMFCGECGQKM